MIPMYTDVEFKNAKSRQLLPLKCKICHKKFMKQKNFIQIALKDGKSNCNLCSHKCLSRHMHMCRNNQLPKKIKCEQCKTTFIKQVNQIKITKNNFCSHSCSAKWNNAHKTHGTRRSKLEVWLEEQLRSLYPDLDFHFNRRDTINAELDIYIPSLCLAFELNGIFHYEPIYGQEKFSAIQTNDQRRMLACSEHGISLCVIDVSSMLKFKPLKSQKYLDIITDIICQA